MTQTYHISGMTCQSCRANVEQKLSSVKGVSAVSVDLLLEIATLESEQPLALKLLQDSLPEKFTISASSLVKSSPPSNENISEIKQLKPLFIIFAYITFSALLMNLKPWSGSGFMLDFMGLFYIVFSFFKLLDLNGFPKSFRMYDPLAKRVSFYGLVYPFIELTLGTLFLNRLFLHSALIATIIILGITTIGVTKVLMDKKAIQCACLGTALKLPMTKATFIENSIMLVMASLMLIRM